MPPYYPHTSRLLQKRWTNADGEKVGLWMSLGILVAFIFFTIILSGTNIVLGKPMARLRRFEDEKAVKDDRVEALTQKVEQLERTARENEVALRTANTEAREANGKLDLQRALVAEKDLRITDLTRQADDKTQQLRTRIAELGESRVQFGNQRDEARVLQREKDAAEARCAEKETEIQLLRAQLTHAIQMQAAMVCPVCSSRDGAVSNGSEEAAAASETHL